MILPSGWAETTISGPSGPERVYRKASGDLALTLDADAIDKAKANLDVEWASFLSLVRQTR